MRSLQQLLPGGIRAGGVSIETSRCLTLISPKTQSAWWSKRVTTTTSLAAWYLWAPSRGAPWGGTLSTTMDLHLTPCVFCTPKRWQPTEACDTVKLMSLSKVACEGSHMRNFGRLVSDYLISSPFSGCGPSAAPLGPWFRISRWPDCTLSRGASARTSTAG